MKSSTPFGIEGRFSSALNSCQVGEGLVVWGHDLVGVGVDDLVCALARPYVERDLLHERAKLQLQHVDVDPGQLLEAVEVRGDGRGRRGVLGDEVERRPRRTASTCPRSRSRKSPTRPRNRRPPEPPPLPDPRPSS